MADDNQLRQDLLWRIEARRESVQAYLRERRPRTRRLATTTVVLSSLAAVFTAGPAFGGESFSGAVQEMFGLKSDSYVWRTLCLLAMLVSVSAAVLTNIGKANDDVARLSSAEAANTELEGLASLLQFGHLTVEDGVKLYQQYSTKIPFVDDLAAAHPLPQTHGSYTPPPGNSPPPRR
jgi:MFS family permease